METNILILASLLVFSPASTSTSLPNLCDDVYLDEDGAPLHDASGRTFSRYCEPTGPRAPKWAAPVCCSFADGESDCTERSATGGCASDQSQMWCDYGERMADNSVSCYQPLPDTCDMGLCVEAPAGATLAYTAALCCFPDTGCWEVQYGEYCGGWITFCSSPYSLPEGGVGCDE